MKLAVYLNKLDYNLNKFIFLTPLQDDTIALNQTRRIKMKHRLSHRSFGFMLY